MDQIILGFTQGMAEWLPVSSQGMLTLVSQFLKMAMPLNKLTQIILLMHLGTFFAALIYFWKDVKSVSQTLFNPKSSSEDKSLLLFLIISTIISGVLGLGLQKLLGHYLEIAHKYQHAGSALTAIVGGLLIITGILQLKIKNIGNRTSQNISIIDGIVLGITQACAALPGISRSGSTVALLLLRGFTKKEALRLSFLMSLPIVLVGNIILNFSDLHLISQYWIGVIIAFISGLATIHIMMMVAEKVNFGLFVMGFGVLTILSAFI